jgi:hypothetical protein
MPLSVKPTQLRRVAPFVAPLGLALIVGYLASNSNDESDSIGSQEPVKSATTTESKSLSLTALRDTQQAAEHETLRLISAPRGPELSRVVESFRNSDGRVANTLVADLFAFEQDKQISLRFAGMEFTGTVDSVIFRNGARHVGVTINKPQGRLALSLTEDDKVLASLMFEGESFAFAFDGYAQNGSWQMKETTVSEILCAPIGAKYSAASVTAAYPFKASSRPPAKSSNGPLSAPPVLNSNPISTYVIYCDFDGEVVTHPQWNGGKTIDAKPHARADDAAFVTKVWARAAEDFAAFDINVTTDRAVFDAAAVSRRVHCVITPTNTAQPGSGGVAYLNSFGRDVPCWAFNAGEAVCADTISHEVGHTLGLDHDGTTDGVEYYGGHGTGVTSWAPIMGAYFSNGGEENVTQWSKGEYSKANNQEDDLDIITTKNGFSYRVDDKGGSLQQAANLVFANGQVADSGVIERTGDADWIRFATSGGIASFYVKTIDVASTERGSSADGSNLAVSAEIYDASGKLIKSTNATDSLNATVSSSLSAGDYFLKVQGAGRGTPSTGFSDYASIGQYTISGSVPQINLVTLSPPTNRIFVAGGSGTFNISSAFTWSWSSSADWVTSAEATTQTGIQAFDYTVAPNNTKSERSATITIRVGTSTATHVINQDAPLTDDHGNTLVAATPITQSSSTAGTIEQAGDVDMFRIDVRGFGNLTAQTSGAADTFGELLDFSGENLISNDSALKPNFQLSYAVAPGTYYLKVSHGTPSGTGSYQLALSFTSTSAISISPLTRTFTSTGGNYTFDVVSNTSWSWSSAETWIASTEESSQSGGQAFTYTVLANTSNQSRTGSITLTTSAGSMVHTVTQDAQPATDDHANSTPGTTLAANASLAGAISYFGDVDYFTITLPTSGRLGVNTTGAFDTYGQLFDNNGTQLAFNNDFRDRNFSITQELNAGIYHVAVSNSGNKAIGSYTLANVFTPSKTVNVQYSAGLGGKLQGNAKQSIPLNGNATAVTAIPNTGYSFAKWSDNSTAAARTDQNLKSHLTVSAEFNRNLSVALLGQAPLKDVPVTTIDFGSAAANQTLTRTFEISNLSSLNMTGLKVASSSTIGNATWSIPALAKTTLAAGEKTSVTISFSSSSSGYKSAYLTVSATGTSFKPFRIPVLAFVSKTSTPPASASSATPKATPKASAIASASKAAAAPLAAASAASPTAKKSFAIAPSDVWVAASLDGYFRHNFRLKAPLKGTHSFWISTDGLTWQESIPVALKFLKSAQNFFEYEATLSPPNKTDLIISVSDAPPPTNPSRSQP